jgi:cytochrome b pre-mRNA-processing protein 3
MIFGLFRKKNNNRAIVDQQYAALTDGARQAFLYSELGVPDTVMGRLEMLSSVLILYFRRTGKASTGVNQIAQEIVDAFFQDVDHSIRELGVGDLSVPKRMKKLAGRFYGRMESYSEALSGKDEIKLAEALKRNFHPLTLDTAPDMLPLARYLLAAEAVLQDTSEETLLSGLLQMPDETVIRQA